MFNKKSLQKMMAVLALVGFVGSTSLVNVSEAATPRRGNTPRQTQSIKRAPARPVINRRPQARPRPVVYHRAPRRVERESHSDTGNLVTGLIIGGVLGAVIANNS